MSDIQQNEGNRRQRNISKGKKLTTRVDLTPMVDLGFLLITFFIFTTSMASPKAMNLRMPDDSPVKDSLLTSEDKTLTVLVASENRLFFYPGVFSGNVTEIGYKELREKVIEKRKQLVKKFGSANLVVLIKATREATYKNIVDCLDEMLINDVSTYMLLEPGEDELNSIKASGFKK